MEQAEINCSSHEPAKIESNTLEKKQQPHALPPVLPEIAYRTNYSQIDDEDIHITSRIKKIHFIDDNNQSISVNDGYNWTKQTLKEDAQDSNTATEPSLNYPGASGSMAQPLSFVPANISPDTPLIRKIPDYMRIPNLWNVHLERDNDNERGDSSSGSGSSREWEFL